MFHSKQGRQTDLEIAAEAISLQIAFFVLVEFDLVLFSDGVPHHDATLGHHLDKLFSAGVRGQAWRKETRREESVKTTSWTAASLTMREVS